MIKELNDKIENIINLLKKMESRKEIIISNVIAGISRGIGIGIGVTIITAVLVLILRHLVTLNIPVLGKYIADVVEIVEKSR